MSTRLPIDGNVVSYWGFDEANPGDVAVEESGQGANLVVYNAPSVVPARLGNGRQFDGATTYAQPATSDPYLIAVNSILVWIILDSVNQAGDLLRPILTLEGPGAGAADDTAQGLYVNNAGAIVYRYTGAAGEDMVFTSPAAIRVNRYYSLAVTRENVLPTLLDPVGGLLVRLYVNNVEVTWASVTADGAPVPNPLVVQYAQVTGGNAVLRVGASSKSPSLWHGVIDELSLHRTARPKAPYLDAAYFRLTLAATFSRLTTQGTVKVLAAVEMGGGTRWWCYERDQSVYVIRENSLGLFSAEVQLTQGRNLSVGAPAPGGVEKPRLAYDPATDTLVIAFLAVGRVYKVTATSTDVPSTLIMPFSADVVNKIVVTDPMDILRASAGESGLHKGLADAPQMNVEPATIYFLQHPSFGVEVIGTNPYGYAVLQTAGGVTTLVGYATGAKQTARYEAAGLYWFVPVASRVPGATYQAFPLTVGGRILASPESNIRYDAVEQWAVNTRPTTDWDLGATVINRDGSGFIDAGDFSGGDAAQAFRPFAIATLYPVKLLAVDAVSIGAGEPSLPLKHTIATTAPIKQMVLDAMGPSAGDSSWLTMTLGNRRVQQ